MKRLTLFWIAAALMSYVVLVLPLVLVLWWSGSTNPLLSLIAFPFGALVGGLTPVLLLGHPRVQRWVRWP